MMCRWRFSIILLLCLLLLPGSMLAEMRGIYVTRGTVMNGSRLQKLVQGAHASHIQQFVVDFTRPSKHYNRNIAYLQHEGIQVISRIVMFPGGATASQVRSQAYLQKQYLKIQQAASLGVSGIQLDYIRYRATQRPSAKNAHDIYKVVATVANILKPYHIPLQIDIFGVAAHSPARAIGQDVTLFADVVQVICPMVYPSHYKPYSYHAAHPYKTVYDSLMALRQQLKGHPHVKIMAYIELGNFRYRMSGAQKTQYILAEMQAVKDADAAGWYAWSPHNHYNRLFSILSRRS